MKEINTGSFLINYGKFILFMALVLLVSAFLLYLTYQGVKREMIDLLNSRQMIHAKQAAKGIEAFFHGHIDMLQQLAKSEHIIDLDATGKRMMRDFYSYHTSTISIITRIDKQGRILNPEPYNPAVIGKAVVTMASFQEARRTRQVTVSDVFTNLRGFKTIIVHVPVFKGGTFNGTIAIQFPFDLIAVRYIEDIRIGRDGYAWVISRDGTELSCPVPGHAGNSVIDNCRDFPDILAMAERMMRGEQGVATYPFDRIRGDTVQQMTKQAVFMPVRMANNFWSIVVATPEDEVMAALEGFRNRLLLITLLLMVAMGFFFYILFRHRILFEEIGRRQKTEEALRQSEERYRGLFEHAVEGIYQSTPEGRFIDVNPAMARMCGYESPEEMIAAITDISTQYYVNPRDREIFTSLLNTNGRIDNIEYRVYRKDGSAIWVSGSARVVRNDYGDTIYYEGRSQDITARKREEEERRRLEEQLHQSRKMESIGTLAGGIAHDFNNLLMGIQGYASLMLMALDEGHPHYEKLRAIERQVQSGADLTRQLLGFARGGRYEVKPTDVNELIARTAAMFGRTKKEIRIHEKYCEGIRAVDADRGQMDQVLLNMCVNAWQAMPGGGELFLETDNVNLDAAYVAPYEIKPGPYVKVSVTDTGVGMDEKTKQRIFDPFFTTKEMGRGTGLGLASAYGIIKGHGGFINVYSEKGHGTTFNIYLPASSREVVREEPSAGAIRRGHETVLVVDDERMILDVTREMLEGLGYRVLVAQSGEDAMEIYRADHGKIDLVILDMIMPGMGGGEILECMKAVHADCRVILSSGYSINGEARTIMAHGARLFLQKPFRLDDLSQKIREVLEK